MKMEVNITTVMIIVMMNNDRLTIGLVVMLMLLFRLINIFMNSIRWSSIVHDGDHAHDGRDHDDRGRDDHGHESDDGGARE